MTYINTIAKLNFYLSRTKIPLIPFKQAYPEPLIGSIKYFPLEIEEKGIRGKIHIETWPKSSLL